MKRLCDLQSALEIFPSSLIYSQQSRPLGNKGNSAGKEKDQYGDLTERQSASTVGWRDRIRTSSALRGIPNMEGTCLGHSAVSTVCH